MAAPGSAGPVGEPVDPASVGEVSERAPRYRSRPVEVEAMQWTGDRGGAEALRSWMDQPSHQYGLDWHSKEPDGAALWVKKSQRWCPLVVGDYVIAESDGDGFYPCKRDIFEDRYDAIEEAPDGR